MSRLPPVAGPLGLALLLALGVPAPAPASPASDQASGREATAAVERLHGALLDAMQHAEELGYAGRHERLAPIIRSVFDLPFMARTSAGRHWKTLSEADQARFVEKFSHLSVATYAARFDGFSGERFETRSQDSASHGTVLVRTRLVKQDGEEIHLDYRLRLVENRWRIIDVFLEGTVSELALRRAEYSSVIRRDGFDALIEALQSKISDYEQGRAS